MTNEEIVATLAEVLWQRAAGPDAKPPSEAMPATQRVMQADAAALLPTVHRIAEQRAAEELRDQATWIRRSNLHEIGGPMDVAHRFDARADALVAAANFGTGAT